MRSARTFILVLILVGVMGAILDGGTIYSRMLYVGVFIGASSLTWSWLIQRSLKFKRSCRELRASAGDIFEEHFEVHNASGLLAPWVEVVNQTDIPFSAGSRLFTLLRGGQRRDFLARTWLTQRGAFPLGPTKVSSGDPLGLFSWDKYFPAVNTLLVLPAMFEIKSFGIPPGLLPGGRVIRRRSTDITPHASGVREYVHGDALKRIHWPTSIRRDRLMVKEFEQDPQAEVWVFLDSQRVVHAQKPFQHPEIPVESMLFRRRPKFQLPPSTLEYAISIAASLVHYFLKQRRAVGFVNYGQRFVVLPAERSERQESKILETLAFVQAEGENSIAAVVEAQASQLPQGSSAILVTPSVRGDLIAAVEDLQRRYLRPLVVLLDSKSFGGERGTDRVVRSLHDRKVPVCLATCESDLAALLSQFSTDYFEQDMRAWQKPELSPSI
ncbi:MAG: DUF58 domain-containing protein [Chloroflexi bacterium]|nr:DUF58 domain-containing protein [Chloroflexota bacterium]